MKVALVHDWLTNIGGSEKVLEAIYEIYPSPIYTLVKNEKNLRSTPFENAQIHTSFIQKLPFAKTKYKNYLFLFPVAIEQFDLSEYDLIITSSHAVAKGVITNANQVHICYCHTPMRYAWDLYHQYLREEKLHRGLRGFFVKLILHYLRIWDYSASNRVDYFIANSNYISRRIKRIYGRDAAVIYPPVDVNRFELHTAKEDFYITVSRMVPYKKIDIIVDAFSKMPERRLVVIGDGPDYEKIKRKTTKNIELLGYQPFDILKNYMQKAKAFVYAAEEDFGIVMVEAQACGTPVIAYGKGGAAEIITEGKTGMFFREQKAECIIKAVKEFEKMELSPEEIRKNAERFSKERFKGEFKQFIDNVLGKSGVAK